MSKHLNEGQLLSYLEHELAPRQRRRVEAHMRACRVCRERVERLAQVATDLTGALRAMGRQVPLAPARSWEVVARRWTNERPKRGVHLFHLFVRYVAVLAILALAVGGLTGLIHTLAVTGPASIQSTMTPSPVPTAGPSLTPGPLPLARPDRLAAPASLLVLGIDGESDTSDQIDALMLFHINAEGQRAFSLSIPRDLYVEVPGYGQALIGSVYGLGERDESTSGLILARETVSATLDFAIQHVALVRLEGFVTLIDTIGGVNIDVPYAIDDPDFPDGRGGHDPLFISAGSQNFDGSLALQYARTQVVPASGFDRTFRQQQLALAVRDRGTSVDLIHDLIAQAPDLWLAIADGLETDLSLSDVIDLALLVTDLTGDDIAIASLDACCTVESTTPAGRRALLPQPDEIETLMTDLLEGR